MVLSHTERIMARRQIDALIRSDAVDIVLNRKTKVDDGAGGWKYGPSTPLKSQTVAIIPLKRRMTEFLINTELGDLPQLPYVIIGYPDLDVEKDDTFTWQGDKFTVETIDIKQDVRIAAQVDYWGGAING